jgi:predicted RNase H-like HicB family nuclease
VILNTMETAPTMLYNYKERLNQTQASGSKVSPKFGLEIISQKARSNDLRGRMSLITRPRARMEAQAMPILTSYIEAAMAQAKYEPFDGGTIYAYVPSCPGVWSNENTREACEQDLRETLEFWLLLKLRDNDEVPLIAGIDLNSIEEVEVVE